MDAKYGRILYSIEINERDFRNKETHEPITFYRFRSLYNDCRGIYYSEESHAIEEGEAHANILVKIYPQLEIKEKS